MVNRNWAIYEGAEVWKPTSLNPTTEIYPENKRSENVNNFASLTAREQTSNNVFSTYQDKISYCKGTMCEQNRRSFYVKAFFFYYSSGNLLTDPSNHPNPPPHTHTHTHTQYWQKVNPLKYT